MRYAPWPRRRLPPEPEWPRPGLADRDEPTVGPSTPSGVSSAHRPEPAANAWPDDAILLTYGELRRLIALHLTYLAATMPHDRPWVWVKDRARALEDGEAPLLLSEILSPPALPPG